MLINLILETEEKNVKKRTIWLYGKFRKIKERKSKENQIEEEEQFKYNTF